MAGTIREFETLREFFNSSTLVILIDLPFVFFFIYVISSDSRAQFHTYFNSSSLVIIVGLGIQPFLARITKGSVESGMNKQAVLVETLNGLETVNATGSGKLMKRDMKMHLTIKSDGGNKIRALSMFYSEFCSISSTVCSSCSNLFGVYLIVEGQITQGALIGAVILGAEQWAPFHNLQTHYLELMEH